jgi:signal transduction histidine kinase
VIKHARAQQVLIRLRVTGDRVCLAVTDDGAGFTMAPVGPGAFGLHIMHERAAALGGAVRITSAPGCGTTVSAHLPRQDGAR